MGDESPDNLLARLERCMPIDRMRLGKRLRSVASGHQRTTEITEITEKTERATEVSPNALPNPSSATSAFSAVNDQEPLADIGAEIDAAERRLERRRLNVPTINFDASLPIVARKDAIAAAIRDNQVVVICGETGSGKTTQLPKLCLEIGRGLNGMIGHTQPRRIAARSVATRIAHELQVPLGKTVGYSVRFTDRSSPDTLIRIMTDGILLAETARDRLLLNYDTIIIDEAHERSLNIDFLLGYLKTLLPRRPDLKVIITSATIDPQRFSAHFDDAPIIEVSGRVWPVEVRYQPVGSNEEADEDDPVMLEAMAQAIEQVGRDAPGDTLVFLSGEREIREASKFLRERLPPDIETLPLYARLSAEEQNRVFEEHAQRRIVLATNVAETSLTVPGIRSVIDPGLARISRYSPNARVQRLPVERISQASAQQRAGRCGRLAAGVCIRLYSEDDFAQRPTFTDPEIQRANLAAVLLQMKALRLGRIEDFPFIDRPRASAIREGLTTLHELSAIDERGELTDIGRQLSRMPVDPRIGRMILAARDEGSVREVLIIAAALSAQDPRLRPLDQPSLADAAHVEFVDERSDFLTFLKLWEWWHGQARDLSSNNLRRLCQSRCLSYVRMREWLDIHRQLQALAIAMGMRSMEFPARYAQIHRALLSGLLGNVGMKIDTFEFLGVSERRFGIFPGSALFRHSPRWIMAAELVETTRLYARTVARIQPEWIEQLAPHVVKRSHSAPRWNAQSSHVEADEKVTLRGLTVIPKRRVHYGAIDLPLARETFIQHALVEGEYQPLPHRGARTDDSFLQHNRRLLTELRDIESKRRRRDVLLGPEAMYAFYDARLPPSVCNGPSFEKWRRKAERRNPDVLRMKRGDVVRAGAMPAEVVDYPDTLAMVVQDGAEPIQFPLVYHHEPGDPDDGVTMIVPVEALRQVRSERCEWLVPGMLRERIAALIKTLPKQWRVNFVPVPEHTETVASNITFSVGVLTDAIARELDRSTGIRVPADAWRIDALPDHLRLNFHIVNEQGEILARGRDLTTLRAQIGATSSDVLTTPPDERFARSGMTHWECGDLPDRISLRRAGIDIFAYPALTDEGAGAGVKVFDSLAAARASHRAGLRRLFVLQVRDELTMHVEYLPNLEQMRLHFAPLQQGAKDQLQRDLVDQIAGRVYLRDDPDIRNETDFRQRLSAGWDQLWTTSSGVADLVERILTAHHDVELKLSGAEDNPFLQPAVRDIREQLAGLMPPRFLVNTPWRWLAEYPRFLNAILIRLQKLSNAGLPRDAAAMQTVGEFWERYTERCQTEGRGNAGAMAALAPPLEEFRWLIEELRVALFAQELRTSVPMSPQRLEKLWTKLQVNI